MSRNSPSSVSVLIPCFDAEPWVADAIASALAQEGVSVAEVLVLDDGSTDGTRHVLRRFGARIERIETAHRGAAAARNTLLARARGEWLQFLDADDTLDPDKLATQLRVALPGVDVVASPIRTPDGPVRHRPAGDDVWIDFARVQLGITSANLWRRDAVRAVGGWSEDLPCCLEYDLLLRMLFAGHVVVADPHALTSWGMANPESLSRRDVALRDLHMARLVHRAAEHLREGNALGPARRRVIVQQLLEIARTQWRRGHASWREVARLLHRIEPEPWTVVPQGRGVYAGLYRALGFSWAQRYDDVVARIRRARAVAEF